MLILREGCKKREYDESSVYRGSYYNISDKSGCIVYNTASGAIVDGWNGYFIDNLSQEDRTLLIENGFLVPYDYDEFSSLVGEIEVKGKNSINFFTIIPTTACNAKCFYCYEEHYCKKTMSQDVLNDLVNYIKQQVQGEKSFTLDWYGGEPLLCVDKIDEIVFKLSKEGVFNNREWSSSITTNATLFDSKLIEHAIHDWRLSVAHITIDGTEHQHNSRKKVSFNGDSAFRTTLNAIHDLLQGGVYANLRIHLDNNNKNDFRQVLDEIAPFFSFDNFHLFPTYLFPPEFEMADSYIRDDEKEELFFDIFNAMYEKGFVHSIIELFPNPKKRGCFATDPHTAVIAPDGSLHACVQEFSSTENWNDDQKFVNHLNVGDNCVKCSFFPICLGGCIHNRFLEGTVRTPCVRNRYVVRPLLELFGREKRHEETSK